MHFSSISAYIHYSFALLLSINLFINRSQFFNPNFFYFPYFFLVLFLFLKTIWDSMLSRIYELVSVEARIKHSPTHRIVLCKLFIQNYSVKSKSRCSIYHFQTYKYTRTSGNSVLHKIRGFCTLIQSKSMHWAIYKRKAFISI